MLLLLVALLRNNDYQLHTLLFLLLLGHEVVKQDHHSAPFCEIKSFHHTIKLYIVFFPVCIFQLKIFNVQRSVKKCVWRLLG